MKPTIYCANLADVTTETCCNSCHEDEENGYDNLFDGWPSDPYDTHFCCMMSSAWKELTDEQRNEIIAKTSK